jgi:hypothetical protein
VELEDNNQEDDHSNDAFINALALYACNHLDENGEVTQEANLNIAKAMFLQFMGSIKFQPGDDIEKLIEDL